MTDAHANFAYSTVVVAPSPAVSGLGLTVYAGEGSRFPTPPFDVTIWPADLLPLPSNAEIARVTGRAGDVFTIVRAQEGSSARTVRVGDQIAATITAKTLTDIENGPLNLLAGSAVAPAIAGTGANVDTGIFWPGTDKLGFAVAGKVAGGFISDGTLFLVDVINDPSALILNMTSGTHSGSLVLPNNRFVRTANMLPTPMTTTVRLIGSNTIDEIVVGLEYNAGGGGIIFRSDRTQMFGNVHVYDDPATPVEAIELLGATGTIQLTGAAGAGSGSTLFSLKQSTDAIPRLSFLNNTRIEGSDGTTVDWIIDRPDPATMRLLVATLRITGALKHEGSTFGALGKTPVTQRSAIAAPTAGTVQDAEARTAINLLRQALIDFGFTA